MSTVPPTVADVAAYLGLPAADETLTDATAAALEAQAARCIVDPYTAGLRMAAIRRAARTYGARQYTLGTVDLGEFGSARITRWDAEIEALEAPHRLPTLAGPR